jgi:hypothetical protein
MSGGMTMKGKYTVENFKKYHEENPDIYKMFCHYALKVAQKRKYYSAKAIFHRVRWETEFGDSNPQAEFKISDGWISHYARKFLSDHPEHNGFFKLKSRKESYFNKSEIETQISWLKRQWEK